MSTLPPWLQSGPGDFVAAARAGTGVALQRENMAREAAAQQAQMAMAAQRIDAAEKQAAIQNKVRQEVLDKNFLLQQQRNNIADAYHTTQLGLAKQKLDDAAKQAAMTAAHKHGYVQAIAAGMTPAEAAAKYPLALTSGVIDEISRKPRQDPAAYETITEKHPAVDAVPPTPAVKHWFKPDEPATPGTPAQLERTVTRRIPVSPIPSSKTSPEAVALKFIRDASGNLVPETK